MMIDCFEGCFDMFEQRQHKLLEENTFSWPHPLSYYYLWAGTVNVRLAQLPGLLGDIIIATFQFCTSLEYYGCTWGRRVLIPFSPDPASHFPNCLPEFIHH
jgi:hypothetical protein